MALPAHSGPNPLISFRNQFSQAVGFLGRVISPSQGRYLNTGQHKHRINAYTYQISILWVGFETTITELERAKTVHTLDRAAIVTGLLYLVPRLTTVELYLQSLIHVQGTVFNYLNIRVTLSFTWITNRTPLCGVRGGSVIIMGHAIRTLPLREYSWMRPHIHKYMCFVYQY
jgi:hypothetical protein